MPRKTADAPENHVYDPKDFGGLIWLEARRWFWATKDGGISSEDLMQAGYAGVQRAAQKFDPARGIKFTTYGMWWARAFMKTEANHHARCVRVPRLRDGSETELMVTARLCPYVQIDTVSGVIPMPAEDDLDVDQATIEDAIASLPERLQTVVRARFFADRNLREIGDDIGVSRERARQLEAQALELLRKDLGCRMRQGLIG